MDQFVYFSKRARHNEESLSDNESSSSADDEDDIFAVHVAGTTAKLPAGPEVELSQFPEMKQPTTFTAGTHSDYLWAFTRLGRNQLEATLRDHGILKSSSSSSKKDTGYSHLCWACFEAGREFASCLFKFDDANRANKPKHHKVHAKGANWAGFVFTKLKDLRGQVCGRTIGVQRIGTGGELARAPAPTTKDELLTATATWAAATAMPLSVTEHPLFREMMLTASRITDESQLVMGNYGLRSRILQLAGSRLNHAVSFLKNKKFRAFVIFDGWDGRQKVMGFSLFFIRDEKDKPLRLEAFPLSFSFTKLDQSTNQMAGEAEILHLLRETLSNKDLSMDVLAGSKSDNAMSKTMASLNLRGLEHYLAEQEFMDADDWTDAKSTQKIGCVPHLTNLVVLYALGEKVAKSTGEDAIPAGPSKEVTALIQQAYDANDWLSNEKNFQRAEAQAQSLNRELHHPVQPNATRWTSHFSSISRAIDNSPILVQCQNEKKNAKVISLHTTRILCQFEAILEPLTIFQRLSQTTSRPFGPAVLPAIAMLLRRYGVECPSVLYSEATQDTERSEKLMFKVRDPGGPEVVMSFAELSSEARCLIDSLQRHLIFRFIKQRENRFFFEVMGMFVDPVMKDYAKRVCGKQSDHGWNYNKLKLKVDRILRQFSLDEAPQAVLEEKAEAEDVPKVVSGSVEYFSDDELPHTSMRSELDSFLDAKHFDGSGGRDLLTFDRFVQEFGAHDPLAFWSKHVNQTSYPTLYAANLVTLAYQPSSAFEESLFSTARTCLTDVRNRIYDSPHVAEAVVTLQHSLSREVARKERARKDELRKLEMAEREYIRLRLKKKC
jgi:hypothetical protein